MKKINIILCLVLICSLMITLLAGCQSGSSTTTAAPETTKEQTTAAPSEDTSEETTTEVTSEETSEEESTGAGGGGAMMTGGWTILDAPSSLSDDELAVFNKAFEAWTGAEFSPIALIATQIVSGTNYCFLAKSKTVALDPDDNFVFVCIYEDLQGTVSVSDIEDIDIDIDETDDEDDDNDDDFVGGWAIADPDDSKVENKDVLEKALEGFVGSDITPYACIASQVVAGTNYCFVVKETRVTREPVSYIALAFVYNDLQGNAEIINIHTIDYIPD